jgi:hypothetical protein
MPVGDKSMSGTGYACLARLAVALKRRDALAAVLPPLQQSHPSSCSS